MKGMKVGDVTATVEQSDSPGSSILLKDVNEDSILGSDSLGARGKRAEEVGAEAAKDFVTLRASGSCLDTFIVDMLAPILCFAGEESRIRIPRVTKHLTTSLHVASLFTSCEYSFDESNGSTLLTIRPTGSPG
jgi:RNA 3'-terminal phosphate cyclase